MIEDIGIMAMKGNNRTPASNGRNLLDIWKGSGIWIIQLVVGVLTRKKLLYEGLVASESEWGVDNGLQEIGA